MKVGLFFGTFNPIHVGHLIIANFMADRTDLEQVWLVVSPQNPLKQKDSLLPDHHRMQLVRVAIEDNPKLRSSNIEFDLPQPSYTINTLQHLREKHPDHSFSLIMGEDNLRTFHKWKNHERILEEHEAYVYPRVYTAKERHASLSEQQQGMEEQWKGHPRVRIFDAPVMKISASYIRKVLQQGHDARYLLTEPVHRYVMEMHFYEDRS